MMSGSNNGYPFTPSQWQELVNQAQIYRHMVQGIPIPSDLLMPIKRSFFLSPPFATQPKMGWSCYQMGYGRKVEDPEPGRCRRTDGKKWRCSKEAYPDSKYCERHMHRGKNRSRKPVEISLATNNNNSNNSSGINSSASSTSSTSSTSSLSSNPCLPLSISTGSESHYPYPIMYPHHYQPQNNAGFSLDSGSSSAASRDYRYCHGTKDVDGYSFMTDVNVGERGSSWELGPLGLGEPKVYEEGKNKHCFVLGADFKLEKPVKERDFFDEWPQENNKGSWMGLEGENSSQGSSYAKTNLSISIPMGLDDFP